MDDYPTLALLAEADGVHVGQDDWPLAELRGLVGPDMMIGVSTHEAAEAQAAVAGGADYIGVGPVFATQTKADAAAPLELDYLDYIKNNIPLPFVALGGVKEHNLAQVIAHGARSVCLVTDIVAADDICAKVQRLQAMF